MFPSFLVTTSWLVVMTGIHACIRSNSLLLSMTFLHHAQGFGLGTHIHDHKPVAMMAIPLTSSYLASHLYLPWSYLDTHEIDGLFI